MRALTRAPEPAPARADLSAHVRLLALLASADPLNRLLDELARYVESLTQGLRCSVLLVDPTGRVLRGGAAPSLPAEYVRAIDGVPIIDGHGSCGTAAARRETVIVEDIERSLLWKDYAAIALAHQLRACWSVPVLDNARELLGTLALYYGVPQKPSQQEVDLIQSAAVLAAFVIQRHRDTGRLRAGDLRLRAAISGARIGLWEADQYGEGVWFDDWCQRIGIDACDGPNRQDRWRQHIHSEDVDRYQYADSLPMSGAADYYEVDYRVRTKSGCWRWIHERGNVVSRDSDGRPTRFVGICLDIDERKTAEIELRRSEERYRTLARLVQGYIFEAQLRPDFGVRFTWADDEFADLFGCTRHAINCRGWQSFIDPRDHASAEQRIAQVASGAPVNVELRITSLAGHKRWLRMAAEPLRDPTTGTVNGMIGMAEDITDRKVLTEQMFEAVNREQRRIAADLHDGLGQVLTGVSLLLRGHCTRVARGERVTAADLEHALELVNGAIENTRALAHGLAPGTLDLGGLTSALQNLAREAQRWSGFTIRVCSDPEQVVAINAATSDHLYRIVQEAVTNIARHAQARCVEIAVSLRDGALVVAVSDDGVGIPDAVMQGFGLRSMRYRADAIGAELLVENIRPRGTRILVRLPRPSVVAAQEC